METLWNFIRVGCLNSRMSSSEIHLRTNLYLAAPYNVHVVYQTQETVFHRDIQTPRGELKIRHAAEYF